MADNGVIVDEVEAAYRHYIEAFNSRDAKEIAELYDRPHAQVMGETGLSIVNDDEDQQKWYELVMAYLDDQGWDHNEIDEVWIWPLSPTLAQLVATSTRYRTDGSVLQKLRANYTLRRRNGTWKVILSFPLLEDGFEVPVLPAPLRVTLTELAIGSYQLQRVDVEVSRQATAIWASVERPETGQTLPDAAPARYRDRPPDRPLPLQRTDVRLRVRSGCSVPVAEHLRGNRDLLNLAHRRGVARDE